MTEIDSKVDKLLVKMTIEEKVGQCLMLSFCGTRLNPGIVESAVDMHCGGFHVSSNLRAIAPYKKPGTGEETDPSKAIDYIPEYDIRADINTPYASPVQYAAVLNEVKKIAADNNHGIPLFIALDQEGDFSADYVRGGVNMFPGSMGLCASGDKTMAYRVAKAVGWQLRACGHNVIHGPVLDVNFNPLSSETSERAYSDQPAVVAEWGAMTLKGFQETGLIATGKHFPGGGDSDKDCHYDQPVIHKPKKLMMKENLLPYRELIPKQLPMIMTAHTVFSGLDPTREVATVSKPIVTELLREELGFEGVVITDSISMKSLMKKYSVPEAGIRAILAGVDLLLFMEESTNKRIMFESLVEAVKSGRISEERLDQSVARLLKLKYEYNLFENADCVDLDKVMEQVPEESVCILLSHDPEHFDQIVLGRSNIPLTLSGHTHGFQFGIEIGSFKLSPVQLLYKRWAGLYSEVNQQLYVNRGLGYLAFPGRVGIWPEITLLELTPARV